MVMCNWLSCCKTFAICCNNQCNGRLITDLFAVQCSAVQYGILIGVGDTVTGGYNDF